MRLAQGLLITGALLGLAAPAQGWTGTVTGHLQAGPALAGADVAWVDGESETGPLSVRRAAVNAAPATVFTIARKARCDRAMDLSASQEVVAVEWSTCAEGGRVDVLVGDGNAGARTLATSSGYFAECAISSSDVTAGIVAVARYNCQAAPVRLYDVAAGTAADLPLTLPMGVNPAEVRIAGRYVAVLAESGSGNGDTPRFEVIVFDRDTGAEAYRANADTFRGTDDWVVGSHRLELQADGAVLYGFTAVRQGAGMAVRYGTASPAAPVLEEIPGAFEQSMGRVAFAEGRAALHRASGKGSAVFGADGAMVNLFSEKPTGGSIDFDGARIAWFDLAGVHNEAFPFVPPATTTPPATTSPPPAVKPPSAPVAKLGAMKSVMKAKALRSFSGTATDADGDLALVRVGLARVAGKKCQTLQAGGRLKAGKRAGRDCVPTTFLNATGTAAWKFKLRKRLPAGRYVLYVQAIDADGHAQVGFSKATGSLHTLRLR